MNFKTSFEFEAKDRFLQQGVPRSCMTCLLILLQKSGIHQYDTADGSIRVVNGRAKEVRVVP